MKGFEQCQSQKRIGTGLEPLVDCQSLEEEEVVYHQIENGEKLEELGSWLRRQWHCL
jgi:hypothetical protein